MFLLCSVVFFEEPDTVMVISKARLHCVILFPSSLWWTLQHVTTLLVKGQKSITPVSP